MKSAAHAVQKRALLAALFAASVAASADPGAAGGMVGPSGAGNIYFEEDFSDNSAGWTLDTEWQIGPAVASPSPGACGNGDPGTDNTPTADNGIAGVVIGGNASSAFHPYYYLTSPPIDLSLAAGAVWLSFHRWLNSDYTPFMQNVVEVYDGVNWVTVWSSGGPPGVQDAAWGAHAYDVSAYVNAAFRVRIGHRVDSGGAFTCSSWNVDDLTLGDFPVPVELTSFEIE